jgi:hypothetical protein
MQESVEKGIIERIAQKPELKLANYENEPKLKFKLYMLTIEEIFSILQKELDEGIEEPTILDFKKALNDIAGGFYYLYRSDISNKLKKDTIQPLIDKASNKLGPALSFKKEGKLEEYLNQLTDCRYLLFELDEYLITITFSESNQSNESNKP